MRTHLPPRKSSAGTISTASALRRAVRAPIDCFERMHGRPGVRRLRTDEAVVRELFEDVRSPARDPAAGKDRREFVSRKTEAVKQRRAVEIVVRVNPFAWLGLLGLFVGSVCERARDLI